MFWNTTYIYSKSKLQLDKSDIHQLFLFLEAICSREDKTASNEKIVAGCKAAADAQFALLQVRLMKKLNEKLLVCLVPMSLSLSFLFMFTEAFCAAHK